MTLAIVFSRASSGIKAPLVTVEIQVSNGVPKYFMSGLPETAVKESRFRIYSALKESGFRFPSKIITVNLAPADLPKEGGRFDLPIALGILAASKQIPFDLLSQYEFGGELALSGELRGIRGALSMALATVQANRKLIIPFANAGEANLVKNAEIYAANHLLDVCAHLTGEKSLLRYQAEIIVSSQPNLPDMSDIQGQHHAKRALEIAAAGQHSLLLIGPPGTGKTMLASRLTSISPDLSEEKALEVAAIFSLSNTGFNPSHWQRIPFRSPHHSTSPIAMIGGGRPPKPGEISLAHHGILFLDEIPEFQRPVLESLREPLESGYITISRAAYQAIFPAQFQLIMAMNPCPCGFAGHTSEPCHCTPDQIKRYLGKLSGPLLDRIDMHLEVPSMPIHLLTKNSLPSESSTIIKNRVIQARMIQHARQGKLNSALTNKELKEYCVLDPASLALLEKIAGEFHLSARSYHRILKVARTIADLNNKPLISKEILSETIGFRHLNRSKYMV